MTLWNYRGGQRRLRNEIRHLTDKKNTILAPGFTTLTGRLRIDIKVHVFGFILNKGLILEFNEDF